tara:strand:- start:26134 stop:28794 length:2661 start_codon:yes stop_codon:yes gene_type:complete
MYKKLLKYCLIISLLFSCSTEKNTAISRGFHNLHAKYNGFFNANEIIKENYQNFLNQRKEDYNKILPIYPLPSDEESKNWYSPMDTAAAKCELVIFRHRMPHQKKGRNRNKEWCKWIDDNWMTIAKTKYYKKDYALALKIFQYVESHYPIENSFYESSYWQAKVLIEMQAYDQAEEILLSMIAKSEEKQEETPKKSKKKDFKDQIKILMNYEERLKHKEEKGQFINQKVINKIYPTLADLYLRNNRKKLAIDFLEKSIELKLKKDFKTRLIYVLAQLYHNDGNFKASSYYQQVVERNPEYEMAFQAKINRALSFSGSQSKAIKSQLLKMLKDDKNIDYFDQIYYALAEIAFNDGEELVGIENLQTSIVYSKENKEQKIKSMKRMADWYYEKYNYLLAYHYYDSIMQIVPKKFELKPTLAKKHKLLSKIYSNNQTISYNDSILKICNLSAEEMTKKIFEVIDKIESDKKSKNEDNQTDNSSTMFTEPSSNSPLKQSIFIWDQNSLQRGKKEFDLKWGERKLEDNWRRSSKGSTIIDDNDFNIEGDDFNDLYESILKNLPCENDEKKQKMKDSILSALFNLGLTHHYETENFQKATNYFKTALVNYQPKNKAVGSAYELYRIYEQLDNKVGKDEMKDLLLSKYPKSSYAKLIVSDSDISQEQKELFKEKTNYQNLFLQYQLANYQEVINQCSLKIKDSLNLLYCKYGMLLAYAQGKYLATKDSSNKDLILTLKKVVAQCQGNEIGDQANEILKKLKVAYSQSEREKKKWKFNYSPDTTHFFVLFAPKGAFNINLAKNSIADFNASSFSSQNLKTTSAFLNTSDQMVIVKKFKGSKEAMDYYLAFKVNNGPIKSYKQSDFFVLSPNNLKELYLEKEIKNYKLFFQEFYL